MARIKHKQTKGRFAGVPNYAMDTPAYLSLRANSKVLLLELAKQYNGKNNGNLSITHSLLKLRGFKSKPTMYKARDELYQKGFIVINCYGGRSFSGQKLPNLYALTWASVDLLTGKHNEMRFTHCSTAKPPLNYFIKGTNPDYKDRAKREKQFKQSVTQTHET